MRGLPGVEAIRSAADGSVSVEGAGDRRDAERGASGLAHPPSRAAQTANGATDFQRIRIILT